MHILIPNLHKDRPGISQQIPRHGQAVAQVGEVRVNAIAPSLIDTPLAAGILRSDQIRENMMAKHPLKRILNPTDVSKTACFLLSEDSNGITGQIIIQDNGLVSLSY